VTVLVWEQDRCIVCARHTIGSKIVLDAPNGLRGDEAQWKLASVRLETELAQVQDRCTVCVKCTISSEIILDAPDVTPR
jgi:hypothetical protein